MVNKLDVSQQYSAEARKANWIVGCMFKAITSSHRDMSISLHSALARLHLEYCVQFWSPQLQTKHEQTGKGPKEGHQDDQRAGEPAK